MLLAVHREYIKKGGGRIKAAAQDRYGRYRPSPSNERRRDKKKMMREKNNNNRGCKVSLAGAVQTTFKGAKIKFRFGFSAHFLLPDIEAIQFGEEGKERRKKENSI